MAEASTGAARELLNALYHAAYSTAHPSTCLPPHLPKVPQGGRIIIIGAGKGTAAMAVATERHYIAAGQAGKISGTISTRHGFGLPTEIIKIIEAGHPVPDANSIQGAKLAIELAKSAGPNDLVLCLLSGGASALWSAPVDGVSFEAKQQLTKQLLKSGAPISEMNCVRKHLSRIKGGKLAAATHPARLLTVAISDVPGDHPDEIGSGPTVADRSTLSDARNVLARWNITPPAEIAAALNNPANETMKLGDPKLANAAYKIVAAPKASIEAAAKIARAKGYRVDILGDSLEGEARDVARFHAAMALDAKRRGEKACDHVGRRTHGHHPGQRLGRSEPGIRPGACRSLAWDTRHFGPRRRHGRHRRRRRKCRRSGRRAGFPRHFGARGGEKPKCRQLPGEQRFHGLFQAPWRSHPVRAHPNERQRFPRHSRRPLRPEEAAIKCSGIAQARGDKA